MGPSLRRGREGVYLERRWRGILFPMEPAASVAAFIDVIRFVLDEIRHRRQDRAAGTVRGDLIDLESALKDWADTADDVNFFAENWANGLPENAGTAQTRIAGYVGIQELTLKDVVQVFQRPEGKPWRTIEDVLRVYAPEVLARAPDLVQRQRILQQGVPEQLERRFDAGGKAAVAEYLDQLRKSQDAIEQSRAKLAAFIASEYPLDNDP